MAVDDNLTAIRVKFQVQQDCPYRDGFFEFQLDFSKDYFDGPEVTFMTKIFHPNIDRNGKTCVEFGSYEWRQQEKTICKLIEQVLSIVVEPNFDHSYVINDEYYIQRC